MDLDNENPWEAVLSSMLLVLWSTVHTTAQHTPSQLVFVGDAILYINQEANWQLIKQRKQVLIIKIRCYLVKAIRKKIGLDKLMCAALETKSYNKTREK